MSGPTLTRFVIIARNSDGQKVATVSSIRPLPRTRKLAQSLLRLTPAASRADIYPFQGTGEEAQGKYNGDPIERVEREATQCS